MFENLAEDIAGHPPEDRASIEDDYVRRTGMLPAALRGSLIGGMFSDDPAAQVAAVRLLAFEISVPHSPTKPLDPKLSTIRDVTWPGRDPVIPSRTY